MTARLLLIDDDARLTTMVVDYLQVNGFEVTAAGSLAGGRELLRQGTFDALLLDLMLPDGDGLDFTRELRADARTRRLPLLMLTARGEPPDRIVGLEIGADDYLPKPFEPRELLARVKALLRRSCSRHLVTTKCCASDGWRSTSVRAQARVDGKPCDLTSHQFDLLVVLAQGAGRVLSRDQIMDAPEGPSAGGVRPQHRCARLAHPRGDRGRSQGTQTPAHRARRRLRVRAQAGRRELMLAFALRASPRRP